MERAGGGLLAGGFLSAFALPAKSSADDSRIPVLFDSDIGTDIDDALTVAYLLSQPRCELLGITTTYGDTVARAMLVSAICTAAGRADVEIHAGSPLLMDGKVVEGRVPQAEVLPRWPHREDFQPGEAVEFMYDTISGRPGEVTLLAVGALTNVARLFALHPDSPAMLKRLVLMNGSFRLLLREYNAARDPLATRQVYEAKVPELVAVDFETSAKCRIGADEARQRLRGGPLDPAADMAEVWFRTLPMVVFYDSLAAAVIFEPDLCKFVRARVRSRGGYTPACRLGKNKPHLISVDVDPGRFLDHYFGVVTA